MQDQIALVEDGDPIVLDIPNRGLKIDVADEVLAERRAKWQAPEPKIKSGWLARYAQAVTHAGTGAICKAD